MNTINKLRTAKDFAESHEEYRSLVENAHDAIFRVNSNGEVQFANSTFCSQAGIAKDAVIGRLFCSFLELETSIQRWKHSLQQLQITKSTEVFIIAMQLSNGTLSRFECCLTPIINKSGIIKSIIGILHDVSVFIEMEKAIEELSFYDTLTKLPNQRFFFRKLEQMCKANSNEAARTAVLFFDLDNFKKINDSLGHTLGDAVLKEFVARIQGFMPKDGFAARLSGNRFAMYLALTDSDLGLESNIKNIQKAAAQLIINQEMNVSVTVSIGIAIYPDHGVTADTMVKHTDIALNQAKAAGRNTYCVYEPQMSEMAALRVELEQSFKRALAENEFELYYQPQQDFETNGIRGVEALLRWKHPSHGYISPADFIPIAEQTGFIVELGEWVLRKACQFIVRMSENGFIPFKVCVNISAMQLTRFDFVDMVFRCLAEEGARPDMLELEITETMLIGSLDSSIEPLLLLKERGIHIALDDFGTGYSSLNYLRKLPINHLKIDKSFVQDIVGNPGEQEIFNSIVDLVHKLKLTVTAEGVETEEQYAFVKQGGCNYLQGYYFCKPITEEAVVLFLKSKKV
ncbi:EAL domain-containing protein [Paenibacillus psychroresistens]|uniref:EAL domain-containing protein n=1 Tax=Paenibacillus psychroresistens TaxID=1778678 RepID=A0A6B8RPE8_9BACL|nr:EAL domain-containing protein [Paenibacillus psychroresistens]QGQ97899.1 EAL domain-containing protein [Paenibacillus psychroresistens]